MRSLEAVLFDLDGTLLDSLELIRSTYEKVFRDLSIPWSERDVMKWLGIPLAEISRHFAGERHTEFYKLYQKYYEEMHDGLTRAHSGAKETLEYLRRSGFRTGIATSKGRQSTIKSLKFTGLIDLIDTIVAAQDVQHHKPQPDPLLKALDDLGVQPPQAVYVGDSRFDIIAGRRAGVKTLGVTWGVSTRSELLDGQPDAIIDSWGDMLLWLSSQ